MTRHTTILAGRTPRLVRVEHRRKRKVASDWSREHVHRVGLAAVADELGTASLLPMGGVMTGERLKALAGRKGPISSSRLTLEKPSGAEGLDPIAMPKTGGGFGPSNDVGKWDIGCAAPAATGTEIRPVLSTGLLAADVCRHIWTERGRFSPVLYGEGL